MDQNIQGAAVGAAVTATIAAIGEAVRRWRRKRSPRAEQADVAASISTAFQRLVDELQKDNARHLSQIKELRTEATRTQGQLARLKGFAMEMFRHVDALEAQLRELGITPKPRPELPAELSG